MSDKTDDTNQSNEETITESPVEVQNEAPIPETVIEQPPAQEPEPIPEPSPVVIPEPAPTETLNTQPIPEPPVAEVAEPSTSLEPPATEHLPPEPQATPNVEQPEPPAVTELKVEPVKNNSQEAVNIPNPVIEPIVNPAPVITQDPNSSVIPQKVLDLTPEELDAARRLWAMQNIKAVQAKSAKVRHQKREELLTQMVSYIKSHAPVTLPMIAYNLNISPRKASDCLRDLVPSGRITATGHTTSRRYS